MQSSARPAWAARRPLMSTTPVAFDGSDTHRYRPDTDPDDIQERPIVIVPPPYEHIWKDIYCANTAAYRLRTALLDSKRVDDVMAITKAYPQAISARFMLHEHLMTIPTSAVSSPSSIIVNLPTPRSEFASLPGFTGVADPAFPTTALTVAHTNLKEAFLLYSEQFDVRKEYLGRSLADSRDRSRSRERRPGLESRGSGFATLNSEYGYEEDKPGNYGYLKPGDFGRPSVEGQHSEPGWGGSLVTGGGEAQGGAMLNEDSLLCLVEDVDETCDALGKHAYLCKMLRLQVKELLKFLIQHEEMVWPPPPGSVHSLGEAIIRTILVELSQLVPTESSARIVGAVGQMSANLVEFATGQHFELTKSVAPDRTDPYRYIPDTDPDDIHARPIVIPPPPYEHIWKEIYCANAAAYRLRTALLDSKRVDDVLAITKAYPQAVSARFRLYEHLTMDSPALGLTLSTSTVLTGLPGFVGSADLDFPTTALTAAHINLKEAFLLYSAQFDSRKEYFARTLTLQYREPDWSAVPNSQDRSGPRDHWPGLESRGSGITTPNSGYGYREVQPGSYGYPKSGDSGRRDGDVDMQDSGPVSKGILAMGGGGVEGEAMPNEDSLSCLAKDVNGACDALGEHADMCKILRLQVQDLLKFLTQDEKIVWPPPPGSVHLLGEAVIRTILVQLSQLIVINLPGRIAHVVGQMSAHLVEFARWQGIGLSITSPTKITHTMTIAEILVHLHQHGCKDITNQLDDTKTSQFPVSRGGLGDVYRGVLCDGNLVSLKCLRLNMDMIGAAHKQLKRAAHELYVWSKCNHPNVLALFGVAQHQNQIAMISPWMENGNLRSLRSQQIQVDWFNVCVQVADGVMYLHHEGIVHGDLKGDNILFSQDFTPKVADFGNAALREYTLQFTETKSRAGTSLNWVAPEVLGEETGLTVEADVYSLGMTILEVITGSIPYAGMHEFVVLKKIANHIHPARPKRHIPPRNEQANLLWALLMQCWAANPQGRPTAIEVWNKMQSITSMGVWKPQP